MYTGAWQQDKTTDTVPISILVWTKSQIFGKPNEILIFLQENLTCVPYVFIASEN